MEIFSETIDVATLFIDEHLLIRGFFDQSGKILNLTPTDIGQPADNQVTCFSYPSFMTDACEVIASGKEKNLLIEGSGDDSLYSVFITPNYTQTHCIDGLVFSFYDITELNKSKTRERFYIDTLELIAQGKDLPEILHAIVHRVETDNPGMFCSILLLDDEGKHLLTGAAPSLPEFYNDAINGVEIGTGVGSCGTAAFINERVIVEDIRQHPYWAPYAELASKANLGSCWSEPVRASDGRVIGTFAIYHSEPHRPAKADISLISETAHLVSIAIERSRDEEKVKSAELANQEKSQFLANMSHELRTPMHAILSFADLGLKRETDKKVERFLHNIKDSATRLTHLLNDLLDLAKLESGKIDLDSSECDLVPLIRQCIVEVSSLCDDKKIEIEHNQDSQCQITIDKKLIHQVVINLLSNAIKFSPEGGTVSITIGCTGLQQQDAKQAMLKVSVTDQGIGIPGSELKTIFDKFTQSSKTVSKAGGTGLGLPICKKIINLHGGEIWAESPVKGHDQGSAFHFTLPVVKFLEALNPDDFALTDNDLNTFSIFIVDVKSGRIRYVNQLAIDNLGYSSREFLNFTIDYIHPNEMSEMTKFIEQVKINPGWSTDKLHCLSKKGEFLAAEITGSILLYQGNEYFVAKVTLKQ